MNVTAGAAGKSATIVDQGLFGGSLTGGPAADLIEAGPGTETINGGGGNDTIVTGSGAETIDTRAPGGGGGGGSGGKTKILWNSDTSGPVRLTGNGQDELVVTANTPGTTYASGEQLSLAPVAAGGASVTHTLDDNSTVSILFTGVSDILLSARAARTRSTSAT